jgi:hypothetical protein
MNPNAIWNISLESYHPYLQPQDVSKGPTTLGTYGSLSKNGKGRFGFLNPLGLITPKHQWMRIMYLEGYSNGCWMNALTIL